MYCGSLSCSFNTTHHVDLADDAEYVVQLSTCHNVVIWSREPGKADVVVAELMLLLHGEHVAACNAYM